MKLLYSKISASGLIGAVVAQSAAAQEPERVSENILFYMPCHAWTEIHGDRGAQLVAEQRTVEFLRDYARASVRANKQQAPEKDWQNADGADVTDDQIVNWIMGWCAKNPSEPLALGGLLLSAAFALTEDHSRLPLP